MDPTLPPEIPSLFVVSGPSGVGKTVLCHEIIRRHPRFLYSISTTTRAPRGSEVEGGEYNYVSVEKFRAMIDHQEFLEWAEVHGNYYGTPRKNLELAASLGKSLLLNIDVVGASKVKKANVGGVFIFIAPPSREILANRLKNRSRENSEEIEKRLVTALEEMDNSHWYDFILVNDLLDRAVAELGMILLQPETNGATPLYF